MREPARRGPPSLAVTLLCEQLLQPVPGGIGTYVRALLEALPRHGVSVRPVVAWHLRSRVRRAGLGSARRLALPRQVLYRAWGLAGSPALRGRTDMVHAPSLAFPPSHGRPLVVTVHDLLFRTYPNFYPPGAVAFHERALSRLWTADVVICPSHATAEAVREIERPPERVEVVPMGTDLSAPETQEIERVLQAHGVKRPYVLWAGTLEPRKNLERTLLGFAHALRSGVPQERDLTLCLVGPRGWLRGEPDDLLAGNEDRVRWLGPVSWQELPALYAGSEAFLFPSVAEGFGLPVLEAMACGAPVVTSDRSALPEVAGDAALLVDPTDAESIGEALARILRDPDLAARLSSRGIERAAGFTWDRTARETASLYRTLTEPSTRRR